MSSLHSSRFRPASTTLERAYTDWSGGSRKEVFPGPDIDTGVTILCNWARALWFAGCPDQALNVALQGLELARHLNHPKTQTYALTLLADVCHLRREAEDAKRWSEAAMEIGRKHDFAYEVMWASILHAWAVGQRGDPDEGCRAGDQLMIHYYGPCQTKFWSHCAWSYGIAGQLTKALDVLDDAFRSGQARRETYYDAELFRVRGDLTLLKGKADRSSRRKALHTFRRALLIARSQRSTPFELRAQSSILRFALSYDAKTAKGEASNLSRVVRRFREGFDTPDLIDARRLLVQAGYRLPS